MAIAFDTTAAGTSSSTTLTLSFTNSGNTLLVYLVADYAGDNVSGVTYNGVSMTLLNKQQVPGDRWNYTFALSNAPTGTHNIVATCSTSNGMNAIAVSYSGCDTTNAIDANSVSSGSGNSLSSSVTTTTAADWLVGCGVQSSGSPTPGAGFTQRGSAGAYSNQIVEDSNGVVSMGSVSATMTGTSGGNWLCFAIALKPGASSSQNSNFLMYMA